MSELESLRAENESLRSELSAYENADVSTAESSAADNASAEESVEDSGYSRTNPAPIGVTQEIEVEDLVSGTYTIAITVNEIVSGEAAYDILLDANKFNDPPEDGMEYVIANITAELIDHDSDGAVSISKFNFDAFSGSGSEYERVSVVDRKPAFSGDVYAGGSITGYTTFMVSADDDSPVIVFGRNYDGSGGIWFSIASDDSSAITDSSEANETGSSADGADPALNSLLSAVETSMQSVYGQDYSVTVDSNVVDARGWGKSISFNVISASVGLGDYKQDWDNYASSTAELSSTFQSLSETLGLSGYSVRLQVVDDENTDFPYLIAENGEVVYDYVNGIGTDSDE
jgi:hypothetical protein